MDRLLAATLALALLAPEDPATLFGEGRYAEAADAFAVEYEKTGDPALLFGRAQALRRAGNCGAAIEVFEEFIATGPPDSDVAAAQGVIDECKRVLGADESEPEPEPERAPEPQLQPRSQRRWYADPIGGALFGVGVGITAVGAGLYGASFPMADERSGESESGYEDRRARVRRFSAAGITLLAAGGALLIAGIVRYAVVARAAKGGAQARVDLGGQGIAIRF